MDADEAAGTKKRLNDFRDQYIEWLNSRLGGGPEYDHARQCFDDCVSSTLKTAGIPE